MENNVRITYPGSEKVYLKGELFPDIRVGMRVVKQTPTVTVDGDKRTERPNPPVYIYDTSGPCTGSYPGCRRSPVHCG